MVFRPVELEVLASQLETSTHVLTQQLRQSQISSAFPKFSSAVISPVRSPTKLFAGTDAVFYRGCEIHIPLNTDYWLHSAKRRLQFR